MITERWLKEGLGWRIGWNPLKEEYQGLLGNEQWALELTDAEFKDFCRLFLQLIKTMSEMKNSLMDEEKISCEAETDLIWLEVEGFPDNYSLHLILNQGRRVEAFWQEEASSKLAELIEELVNLLG